MTTRVAAKFGSDLIVDLLKALGIEYVALNPGSTFRGIHDSIVNYGGNSHPEVIECNHEEIAAAIAHGYAKASGKPMVAMAHNVVGLLHSSMAIFNAWCDRVPILVMGGTGPMDTTKRRPWIDWIHTALVQGNLVREFVKWDDQPASIEAMADSILRAWRVAVTEPRGPVYVCFDVEHQEAELPSSIQLPDISGYTPPSTLYPDPNKLEEVALWLVKAESPVVIADRMGRKAGAVEALVKLAETLAAPVIDKSGSLNFPNTHPLDLTGADVELLSNADVILALDVDDLFGSLHRVEIQGRKFTPVFSKQAKIIHISLKEQFIRGWAADFQQLPKVDLPIAGDSAAALQQLLPLCQQLLQKQAAGKRKKLVDRQATLKRKHEEMRKAWRQQAEAALNNSPISTSWLAAVLGDVIKDKEWVLVNGSLGGWPRRLWNWEKPGQFLGDAGGGGLGYGPGASVGAALAYRGSGVLCIDLQPDGDFMFCPQALWTAAHHQIPLLFVLDNNRTYLNSENHQGSVARQRGRRIENRLVGTEIDNPAVDFKGLARSLGIYADGPIEKPGDLSRALQKAVRVVLEEKRPALVDVHTEKPVGRGGPLQSYSG